MDWTCKGVSLNKVFVMGFESGVEEKFQLMEAIFGKIVKLQCPTLSEGHWTLEKLDNIGF